LATGQISFAGGFDVDDVVARGKNADEFQLWQLSQRFSRQWRFVGQQDVGAARPLEYLIQRCPIVTDEFSEFRYLVPGVVTGIQSVAIENNDFHSASIYILNFEADAQCRLKQVSSINDAVQNHRVDVVESRSGRKFSRFADKPVTHPSCSHNRLACALGISVPR
jgi:hypothetical protein